MRISQTFAAVLSAVFSVAGLFAQSETETARVSLRETAPANYVWVAAHRADWIFAPENSIPALENAVFFGADLAETDVRLTKDGNVVMMHDARVDRTTNGHGNVADLTLEEIKTLRLKTAWGDTTALRVPTLDEYLKIAKGKIYLYLDKAGYDLPGHEAGTLVKRVLEILRKHDALSDAVFVLDWHYEKAKRIFGDDLEKVIFCPVIHDGIPDLEAYVNEYIEKLAPVAFQFRFNSENTKTFRLLPTILNSGTKAFVAATWDSHTANHGDRASIFGQPRNGWGWLISRGFRILETNYPRDLIRYLREDSRR